MSKIKREKIQINKIRGKKWDKTANTEEIQTKRTNFKKLLYGKG